jgi:two-component system, cell cycle response regulator DivK
MPEDPITAANARERFECALDRHRFLGHADQRRKGAAGEFLAVPTVTHRCGRRVGLGCVAYRAAEATAFDLLLDPLALLPVSAQAERVFPIDRTD